LVLACGSPWLRTRDYGFGYLNRSFSCHSSSCLLPPHLFSWTFIFNLIPSELFVGIWLCAFAAFPSSSNFNRSYLEITTGTLMLCNSNFNWLLMNWACSEYQGMTHWPIPWSFKFSIRFLSSGFFNTVFCKVRLLALEQPSSVWPAVA
jgi:hypothetical protein